MQSYSFTITCSIVTSLPPNGLLTPNEYKFYNKIFVKYYFAKLQTHFSQDILFIGCDIFPQVMIICLHFIKHVLIRFQNHFSFTSLYPKRKIVKLITF